MTALGEAPRREKWEKKKAADAPLPRTPLPAATIRGRGVAGPAAGRGGREGAQILSRAGGPARPLPAAPRRARPCSATGT